MTLRKVKLIYQNRDMHVKNCAILRKTLPNWAKQGPKLKREDIPELSKMWENIQHSEKQGTTLIKRVGIREGVCNSFGGKFSLHMFRFFN